MSAVAAGAAVLGLAGSASASEGQVVVFSNEVTPLTTYRDPYGCQKLPADAHEINNLSDSPVTLYGDPFCMTPSMTVQPGHGSHVSPGSGSFSAE